MSSYQVNREWSNRFLQTIRTIVGPQLLVPAPLEVDQKEATDLIVLRARDMRIACRVRRPGYADDYPNEFTIRSRLDNGHDTELKKIVNGFADWMFYGHALDENESTIIEPWWLIDLDAFRVHLERDGFFQQLGQHRISYGERSNHDGTYFVWFDITSFSESPQLVIASSQWEIATQPPTSQRMLWEAG